MCRVPARVGGRASAPRRPRAAAPQAEALTHKIKQPPTDFLYMLARIHHARRPPATERGARLSDVLETAPAEEPTFDTSLWKDVMGEL